MCTCGTEVETTEYSLWCCRLDSTQKIELFENLEKVDLKFKCKKSSLNFFYGSQTNNSESLNKEILKNFICYLKASTRFGRPLLKIFSK